MNIYTSEVEMLRAQCREWEKVCDSHLRLIKKLKKERKPWVGLTQQDIDIAFDDTQEGGGFNEFARAIEVKLKEKNHG